MRQTKQIIYHPYGAEHRTAWSLYKRGYLYKVTSFGRFVGYMLAPISQSLYCGVSS